MSDKARRRQNFQNIAWFWDLRQRDRIDLDPPYQRRSVWGPTYREDFIDTILLDYPAPAIFLFAAIEKTGVTKYQLVDGKQRLTTIFEFIENRIPVSDRSPLTQLRGKYFKDLDETPVLRFWDYDFSVEYLPTNDQDIINTIFDRLNRNVARLTPQELRHARFKGHFITVAEGLADWMAFDFERNFPRITPSSRRQMKDVELVATLLLLLDDGAKSYSVDDLDTAFSNREDNWERKHICEDEFRWAVEYLRSMTSGPAGQDLIQSRLRNQADYYSLFAAIALLHRDGNLPADPSIVAQRLRAFVLEVENSVASQRSELLQTYLAAARSASNDAGPRTDRIRIMTSIIVGGSLDQQTPPTGVSEASRT